MNERPYRVRRGGSWRYDPLSARVAIRYNNSPGNRYSDIGIRLVEEVVAPEPVPSAPEFIRVFQGSGWNFDPQNAWSANRINDAPFRRGRNLGLRLVEEVINEQE